jgi:potassium-transporting ATPase KdpC subunit
MIRRLTLTAIGLTALMAIMTGIIYPMAVYGIGRVAFRHQTDGSFISRNGQVIGSSLLGQNFTDKNGNPLQRYFQPRPSAAGAGYDASASSATNYGPGDPRLIGNDPANNPYATTADPACVPVQSTDKDGNLVVDKSGNPVYDKNPDGSYVCNPNTVPERVLAYRALNGVPTGVPIPVDAVTASGSGLDPDISVANAELQAPRVAKARNLPLAQVMALIKAHITHPTWGFLGEERVNVLELNLALDRLGS